MATEESLPTLNKFLAALRFEGIPIGSHELVWLQHVFAQEPELDRDHLKTLLACTLIKNPSQRETFDILFDNWCPPEPVQATQLPPTPPDNGNPPVPPDTPDKPEEPSPPAPTPTIEQFRPAPPSKPVWLTWQFWGSLGACFVLGALVYVFLNQPGPIPVPPVPTPPPPQPQPPPPEPASSSLPFDPVNEYWTWVPKVAPPPIPWFNTLGLAISLALLSLLTGAFLLWRYRRQTNVPEPEDPPRTGPQWFPLPDLETSSPELLDPEALRTAVWGVERFVSDEETHRIHVDNTVAATAASGGVPTMRFEPAVYPREVWLWRDTMVQDATIDRLVEELEHSLSQAGLPVRIGSFVDTPALVRWREGQEFSPLTLEGHRQSALVLILTDGYGMQLATQNALEQTTLSNLLRSFGEWPRLTFVDVGNGEYGLTRQVQVYGLSCIAPQAIPAYLGAQTVQPFTKHQTETNVVGDLRAWAAATALSQDPVTAEHAFALRNKLKLDISPWAFRDLLRAADCFDDRLAWQRKDKVKLLNWLVQCSTTNGNVAENSPLALALGYWIERYQAESQERNEQHTSLLPWRRTPAEQRVRMETALLELWDKPEQAARTLHRLSRSLGDEIQERLNVLADWSRRDAKSAGIVYLPWRWSELPPQVRWMLSRLGFGSQADLSETGALHMPASLSLALGLSGGITLASIGVVSALFIAPKTPELQPFLSPPFRVIQNFQLSGAGEYRLTIGTPKQLEIYESLPGNSTVEVEWKWKPQENIEEFGNSQLWHAGTLAQPLRGCEDSWPARSLFIIQAEPTDKSARQLAIQLLDRGSADRVLLGTDWPEHMDELVRGASSLAGDQQLIIVAPRGVPIPEIDFPGAFGVVRGSLFATLAKRLESFSGVRPLPQIWPKPEGEGQLMLRSGPEEKTDEKTGIMFVKVCGGTFTMGSNEYDSEKPPHPVTLESFEISKTETTNAQYQLFEKEYRGEEDLPVVNVSWEEAQAFCENFGYALPTEAEWEYAARGGSTTRWSFGDDEKQLGDYAWFSGNSKVRSPVGQKLPNPLGLYDMHGNVWEWGEDCWDGNAYKDRSPFITNPLVDQGVISSCDTRVLRGGSFLNRAGLLWSAYRDWFGPDAGVGGFRCVRRPRRQP